MSLARRAAAVAGRLHAQTQRRRARVLMISGFGRPCSSYVSGSASAPWNPNREPKLMAATWAPLMPRAALSVSGSSVESIGK
jgi:hypothetical protein